MTRPLAFAAALAIVQGIASFAAPSMACPGHTAASPATTALGDIDPSAPAPEPAPAPTTGG